MPELDRLRSAYARIEPEDPAHLSDEQWERLASDGMDPPEKQTVLDHILGCPECSQIYRGVLTLRREAHSFDPGAPRPVEELGRPAPPRRWRMILPGLAAAAAVIVAFLVVRPQSGPGGVTAPDGNRITLRTAGSVAGPELSGPVGRLDGLPDGFAWKPVEGARGYIVELLDGDGNPVWRSTEVTGVRIPWPQEVERSPGRYYWRVLAVPGSGGPPVPSELVAFDITASPR